MAFQKFLPEWSEKMTGLGYSLKALSLDSCTWCEWPRPRIYIVGVHDRNGGMHAVEWIVNLIKEITRARGARPASLLWGGILSEDKASMVRRIEAALSCNLL